MYYVYVLFSKKDQHLYIGMTNDLRHRLAEHRYGLTPSTRPRRPLQLIFYEAHASRLDAVRRERYFKTSKGKATLRQMLRDTFRHLDYKGKGTGWDS